MVCLRVALVTCLVYESKASSRRARVLVTDQASHQHRKNIDFIQPDLKIKSTRIIDFHIFFSSNVIQFLAIPIRRRISDSLLLSLVVQAPREVSSLTTSTWLGPTCTTYGTGSVPPMCWILVLSQFTCRPR